MTKVKRIFVKNLRQVTEQELELGGASVVITAGNNKGKSTILRSLIDRLQGEKLEGIIRQGESNGLYEMEFTDGCKVQWKITDKSESLTFITKDGLKVTSSVISIIQNRYFGGSKKTFSIDIFLTSTPKAQSIELQRLIGIDFTEIDSRYKIAYQKRTDANAEYEILAKNMVQKPIEVKKPDITKLKSELADIVAQNSELKKVWEIECAKVREDWKVENDKHFIEIQNFNDKQKENQEHIDSQNNAANLVVRELKNWVGFAKTMRNEIENVISNIEDYNKENRNTPQPLKPLQSLPSPQMPSEPDYNSTADIAGKIEAANIQLQNFAVYESEKKRYNDWVANGTKAKLAKEQADIEVKKIEKEKKDIIATAKMPEGFEFSEDGLLYNGFILNRNNQSTSALYIAGLKLQSMVLGELKFAHFEASALDKNSLLEVEKYANSIGLQLGIERPDWESGEIRYELISE